MAIIEVRIYIFLYNECEHFIEYQICGNSIYFRSSIMSVMAVDDVSVRVANGCVQKDKEVSHFKDFSYILQYYDRK